MAKSSLGTPLRLAFDKAGVRPPNFFIVGAPRCGTTAMAASLTSHPSVFLPNVKEPHAFGSDLAGFRQRMTPDEYVGLFGAAGTEPRLGEASVWYLRSMTAAQELYDFDPKAKIIVLIRNPVDMMYSLHGQALKMGLEHIRDFGDALAAEPDRREGKRIRRSVRYPGPLLYSEAASFLPQIERYLDRFGIDAMQILLLEELRGDPHEMMAAVQGFLGVPVIRELVFPMLNQSRAVRSPTLQRLARQPVSFGRARELVPKRLRIRVAGSVVRRLERVSLGQEGRPSLPASQRRALTEALASDIRQLEKLLGRNLSSWWGADV